MASYKGHLTFSTALGAAYGAAGLFGLGYDWGVAGLAGGLTAVGGLLPDLDSDSGVPVREMFGLAAALTPFLLYNRLLADPRFDQHHEQIIVALAVLYLFIRYGLSNVLQAHHGASRHVSQHSGDVDRGSGCVFAGRESVRSVCACISRAASCSAFCRIWCSMSCAASISWASRFVSTNTPAALSNSSRRRGGATLMTYALLGLLGYLAYLDWRTL